jgi:hypothetical protein
VGPVVKVMSFYCEAVFVPKAFDIDQRRTAFTEEKVLERRKGQKIIFIEHVRVQIT